MVCEHVGGGERGHHGGREHLEVTEPEEERPDGGGEPQEKRLDEGGELGHLGAVAVPETTGREWERWWARGGGRGGQRVKEGGAGREQGVFVRRCRGEGRGVRRGASLLLLLCFLVHLAKELVSVFGASADVVLVFAALVLEQLRQVARVRKGLLNRRALGRLLVRVLLVGRGEGLLDAVELCGARCRSTDLWVSRQGGQHRDGTSQRSEDRDQLTRRVAWGAAWMGRARGRRIESGRRTLGEVVDFGLQVGADLLVCGVRAVKE